MKSSANNAWAKRRKTSATKAASQGARTPSKPAKLAPVQLPIVGIGASAGGLEAFTELLHNLPTDTGMAFVLVQHLDPAHASALTQLLSKATSIPVREVTNNLPIEPNQVYVIPPNTDLAIAQGALKLQPRLHTAGAHRSIDFFFQSLAQDQHKRAIGVVLSGAASDGTLGLEAIKAEGGITFAQDESAKYDSMPRSAIAAGCVDFVLAPEKIAKELARIAKHPLVVGGARTASSASLAGAAQKADTPSIVKAYPTEDGFKKILLLLRNHSAVDFSLYKSSTIQRRINRRMVLNKLNTFDAYAQFLRGNAKELDALYSDVLINVTSFFRNPEAFDVLKRAVFPKLVSERRDEPVRVWVLGCSTGQEAYSLAMAFTEFCDRIPRAPKLQIFATDLNDALLVKARAGLYAKSMVQDVSPERLRRFFVEEEGGCRVIKPLREAVVFARHNLLSDPPFSRMDLVTCRNLLIYIDPGLQKKVMPTFHYALRPKGFLFLGAAEAVGTFTGLFEPVDKKHKIYSREPGPSPALQVRLQHGYPGTKKETAAPKLPGMSEGVPLEPNAQREADRVTRNRYAPPGVLVNAELQVLQFRGDISPYLKPPAGQASFNVLRMAREGLMLPLRVALDKAKQESKVVRKENVLVSQNGQTCTANLEVVPLKNLKERCYLISFEAAAKPGRAVPIAPPQEPAEPREGLGTARLAAGEEFHGKVELEIQLAETRDYLQSLQEQSEAVHEALQASNEEVTSANEELQSLNEELETSKEELESANEELITVNEEMAHRNTELNCLNSDLTNLQTSTHLALLLLGRDLTIRRFSAQAQKQFNLLATDMGRPISNVRHNLDVPDLEGFIAEVIHTAREGEREVRDKQGRWHSLRVRPYLTLDNKVDGAVLILVDIDALKCSEQKIATARDYAANTLETVREPLLVLDSELRVESANRSFYRCFGTAPAETAGKLIYDLGDRQWDIPELRRLLNEILPQHTTMENFEVKYDFKQLGRRIMLLNARRIDDPTSKTHRILLAIEDITESRRLQEELQRARIAESIIRSARDPLVILDAELCIHSASAAFYKVFNLSPAETPGCSIFELGNHQWNLPRLRKLLEAIIPRHSFFNDLEVTLELEPVGRRTFLLDGRLLDGDDGGCKRILLSFQDITEVLQFQTELRRSEARKDAILRSALDAIITMDHEGKVVEFNPAAGKMFGYSRAEVMGKEMAKLILPARLRQAHRRGLAHYLATGEWPVLGKCLELPALHRNGTEFPAELTISTFQLHRHPYFTITLRDITERKGAEAALRESEERYRRLVEVSPEGIFILRNYRLVFANRTGLRFFRATRPDQVIGKSLFTFVLPDYRALTRRRLRQVLELGRPALILEEKIVRLDGTVCDVEMAASPFPDQGGVSIQVVMQDIGETKLLGRGILSAIEQEQKRMGRDLHDGVCQLLTAAKFKASLLEHKLARKFLVEASDARALEGQLNKAIEQSYGLAQGLNPVKLVDRGLMAALAELAAGVESAFQLRCVCHFPEPVPVRDHLMANHLYRIAQEATQNAVQHGKAKNIRIGLKERGKCIILTVEDDGVGFSYKVKRKVGMGLQNMQARAAIVGALLDIRTRKQGGTLVTCRLEAPGEESKQ